MYLDRNLLPFGIRPPILGTNHIAWKNVGGTNHILWKTGSPNHISWGCPFTPPHGTTGTCSQTYTSFASPTPCDSFLGNLTSLSLSPNVLAKPATVDATVSASGTDCCSSLNGSFSLNVPSGFCFWAVGIVTGCNTNTGPGIQAFIYFDGSNYFWYCYVLYQTDTGGTPFFEDALYKCATALPIISGVINPIGTFTLAKFCDTTTVLSPGTHQCTFGATMSLIVT